MKDLAGKTAFVTGGASGIGYAIAEALAGAGMNIALADVEEGALLSAAERLKGSHDRVLPVAVDVSDRDAMKESANAVANAFGNVHVLCNNAGVQVYTPLDKAAYADWDWLLGVNLGGVINGLMTFLPGMTAHGEGGHVVNTASVGGLIGMPNIGIYAASKFAVVGLSECLKADLIPHGIGVSILCPGHVHTALGSAARNRPAHLEGTPEREHSAAREESHRELDVQPKQIGEAVLQGIRDNSLYINTHPEFLPYLDDRHAALRDSFKSEPNGERVKALRAAFEWRYT